MGPTRPGAALQGDGQNNGRPVPACHATAAVDAFSSVPSRVVSSQGFGAIIQEVTVHCIPDVIPQSVPQAVSVHTDCYSHLPLAFKAFARPYSLSGVFVASS